MLVAVGQARLDDHLHAFQQFVVGGGEQRPVEGEVGLDGVARAALLAHGGQRRLQRVEVGVGAAGRGQPDGGRFDDGANLAEVAQQREVGAGAVALGELPAQHVGVEQIPVGARPHEGAALLAGVDHALGREHLQRLAQGRQADVQLALQGRHVERRSLGDLAAEHPAGEGLHGLAVHSAARVWRHVSAFLAGRSGAGVAAAGPVRRTP